MLSEEIQGLLDPDELVTVGSGASVFEVAGLMMRHGVSAVIVVDAGLLSGIFTVRDAVLRVVAQGLDSRAVPIGDVMTPGPLTIGPRATFGRALVVMRQHGFRQLPVVDQGKLVGIISIREALDPELEDFICEQRRRQAFEHPG